MKNRDGFSGDPFALAPLLPLIGSMVGEALDCEQPTSMTIPTRDLG